MLISTILDTINNQMLLRLSLFTVSVLAEFNVHSEQQEGGGVLNHM